MHVNINTEAMKHIRSAHEDHDGDLPLSFNVSAMRQAFIAGVDWQREYDAARGPRSVSGVGDAPATGFLSSVETMDEAKAQVLPDQAGGIRVEWTKGQPCFIGFGDAHAINTLIASIRDQKMDVAKAALNSDCVTGDLPGNWGGDLSIFRMLSSIENRLIELAGGPGIGRIAGWLERIDKDLYHVTHRQESIDIEQRRMIEGCEKAIGKALDNWGNHLHDMMEPTNEKGCPEDDTPDIDQAFEFFNRSGLDPHQFFSNYGRNEYAAYLILRSEKKFGDDFSEAVSEAYMKEPPVTSRLEEVSDELLDQLKEQIPVDVYVAEVSRRQNAKAAEGESAYTGENTDWLAKQLRISQTLERFWREAAATMGQANIDQRERIMQMGELIDSLTNRR